MNHSYATFPGVVAVLSAKYTLAHGITPGVISFEIAPQTQPIATVGNVVFYHGNLALVLTDCKADQASMLRGSNGTLVSFQVFDRRWRWRYGEIYGWYNQKDADGKIVQGTEKTPQQLVQLLLTAMGEQADVSQVPNESREEVQWLADNPAEALATMLERFGMSLVLRPDGAISLVKIGQGNQLPVNEFLVDQQISSNPPDLPAKIRILGAPQRYQARLDLEPVAYDTDGKIKHIDDLSYKPATGWEAETQFLSSVTDKDARTLALRDVLRLYRIRDTASKQPKNIVTTADGETAEKLRQILPLQQGLVETVRGLDQIKKRKPERVFGVYWLGNTQMDAPRNSTTSDNYEYKRRFSIEGADGLVRFDEQVVKWNKDSKRFEPPDDLKLECSFCLRSLQTGEEWRWIYDLPTNSPYGYGTDVVRREEILREFYEEYPQPGQFSGWKEKTVLAEINAASSYYAQGRLASYVTASGAAGTYVGLQQISPDGSITQVSWEIGPGGCITTAAYLSEPVPYVPAFKERRMADMQRGQRRAMLGQQRGRP